MRCSTWSLGWIAGVLAGLDCSFVVWPPLERLPELERCAEEISVLAKRTEKETSP